MKANNLTICIDADCDKNCPYCISKMTWNPLPNSQLFERNICTAKQTAKLAAVSSVLITSKGEPLNNLPTLFYVMSIFKRFPLELQTNGLLLTPEIIDTLSISGLNTLAISIDNYDSIPKFKEVFYWCISIGMTVRLTIVLTDLWKASANKLVKICREYGIKQLTFRHATFPDKLADRKIAEETRQWIRNHYSSQENFLNYFRRSYEPKNLVRKLPFGPSVYGIEGITFTEIDYCIQEHNDTEDIRSLIYHQDGHMYTSWDKPESILF